jgi:hypothetical protein
MVHKILNKNKKPEDIDVFWYLEEILLKKDLDDNDWYHARTNGMILGFADSLNSDLVGFVQSGEGVSRATATKAVNIFRNGINKELKEHPRDKPVDVNEEYGDDYMG